MDCGDGDLGYFPWIGAVDDGWRYSSMLPVPKAIYFEAETASWLDERLIIDYLFRWGIDDALTRQAIAFVRSQPT